MKQLMSVFLIALMLVGTIGMNVQVHYCGGELVAVSVNGVCLETAAGEEMGCCNTAATDDDGCPMCKFVHHGYHISSQICQGQALNIQPLLSAMDWFHGDLPQLLLPELITFHSSIIDTDAQGYYYLERCHPVATASAEALRAPPQFV